MAQPAQAVRAITPMSAANAVHECEPTSRARVRRQGIVRVVTVALLLAAARRFADEPRPDPRSAAAARRGAQNAIETRRTANARDTPHGEAKMEIEAETTESGFAASGRDGQEASTR